MQNESPAFVELSPSSISSKLNRYSEEEKNSYCEEWKKSGLSMNEYCKRAGIGVSSLSNWVNSNKKQPTLSTKVKIENTQATSPHQIVEIILVSGLRLRFHRASMAELLRFIKALESCN